MKKLVTTVQITLNVVHDEDFAPTDVARVVADIAHDALVWTSHPGLERAIDDVEVPIEVVQATVIATRPHEEKLP